MAQVQAVAVQQSFSGPLPHPDLLAQYNDVVPNGAERIMRMAEEQSSHRMQLENRSMTASIIRQYFGLAAGLVVSLAGFWLAYQLVLANQSGGALILSSGTIATLVGVFVYGSKSVKEERLRKQRMLTGRPERD